MLNTPRSIGLLLLAAPLLIGGCAEGREAPEPTGMVPISDNLSYWFGAEQPCFVSSEKDTCDPASKLTHQDLTEYFPQVLVKVDAFEIDVHEVTNLQFEYCVAAGGCDRPTFHNAVASTQNDYYENAAWNNHPVVNVTFEMAAQYCEFVGKRLPTEAEWERVAKGPDAANPRPFPADGITTRGECKDDNLPTRFCNEGSQELERTPRLQDDGTYQSPTADVLTESKGKIFHMFGNASEWVNSWYDKRVTCRGMTDAEKDAPCSPCWKCLSQADQPCISLCQDCPDCETDPDGGCFYACPDNSLLKTVVCNVYPDQAGGHPEADIWPGTGDERVVRGGSVADDGNGVCKFPSSGRFELDPLESKGSIGFRCAKTL